MFFTCCQDFSFQLVLNDCCKIESTSQPTRWL